MVINRIIPCVLYSNGGLVKTIQFKSPNYIGDPINSLKLFNDKGVDELLFIDIDASKKNTPPDLKLVGEIASECFMPLTYGGGVKDLQTIEKLLKLGVEKIAINSAFISDNSLCQSAVKEFGSSTIIGSIDVKKNIFGKYKVFDHRKGKTTNNNPIQYARQLEERGVGEIFLNNVDCEGTMKGFDLNLIKMISDVVNVPIIPCGGAGSLSDVASVFKQINTTAVAAGSIFVYTGKYNAVLINFPNESNIKEIIQPYGI
jgi:imidazole glycerol-phosphate synthase subunit HisF